MGGGMGGTPWGMIAGLVAGEVKGSLKAKEDRERYRDMKNEQSVATRMSPWTRVSTGESNWRPGVTGTKMQAQAAYMDMGQQMYPGAGGGAKQPQPQQQKSPWTAG